MLHPQGGALQFTDTKRCCWMCHVMSGTNSTVLQAPHRLLYAVKAQTLLGCCMRVAPRRRACARPAQGRCSETGAQGVDAAGGAGAVEGGPGQVRGMQV